jgi:hypothetical protein
MPGYIASAEAALVKHREWALANPERMVDDVWRLPLDCPLWGSGLSSFQASWVHGKIKREIGGVKP